MNEAEWLTCADPEAMLRFLGNRASDRKLRLFAAACCRRLWDRLTDDQSRNAVEVAERFADGQATFAERRAAAKAGHEPGRPQSGWSFGAAGCTVAVPALHAAERASGNACLLAADDIPFMIDEAKNPKWQQAIDDERRSQAPLLRDIIGPGPFCETIDLANLRSLRTVELATSMYDRREFGRLPKLAEMLAEAGCGNVPILDHCRSEGPHVRGCWVIDLVLGKA